VERGDLDETRASARLPHLDIDIVHRRSRGGAAEQLSVTLQATPSFDAFAQFLQTVDPIQFWARVAQMMWLPWLAPLQTLAPRRISDRGTSATPSPRPPAEASRGT